MDIDRLTTGLLLAIIILVVASIIALWQWFQIIGAILLIGLAIGLAIYGGLQAYGKYRSIHYHYHRPQDRGVDRASSRRSGANGEGDLAVGQNVLPAGGGTWLGKEKQSFGELIQAGAISPSSPMLVGFGADGAGVTSKSIRTMGIGGVQGSGKTVTTLNTILSQIVHTGGDIRYLVIDPHMYGDTGEELVSMMDSLYPFFLTLDEVRSSVHPGDTDYLNQLDHMEKLAIGNPNPGGEELLEWVKLLRLEMDRRSHGKKNSHWVVVIDEFSSVMKKKEVAKEVADILETLSEEARKFHITLLLVGQVWKSSRTGGTEVRDTLPEFKAHRMPLNWAKLVVPDDVARQVTKLETGYILYYHDGKDDIVRVPYTTELDAKLVAIKYAQSQAGQVRVTEEPIRRLPRGKNE